MFFKSELDNTLIDADELDFINKNSVRFFLSSEILKIDPTLKLYPTINQKIEFVEVALHNAGINRKNAISALENKDPEWIKYALLESFLFEYIKNLKSGGKSKNTNIMKIVNWINNV